MLLRAETDASVRCFDDPTARTLRLKYALLLLAIVTTCALFAHLLHYQYLNKVVLDSTVLPQLVGLQNGVFVVQSFAFIVVLALSFDYIYRASENVLALGARQMKYSSRWLVLWFFVPVANLWHPYAAMKEIGKCSSSPLAWHAEPDSPLLHWWWGLSVSSAVFAFAALGLRLQGESLQQQQWGSVCFMVFNLLCIALCVSWLLLSAHLAQLQIKQSSFELLD